MTVLKPIPGHIILNIGLGPSQRRPSGNTAGEGIAALSHSRVSRCYIEHHREASEPTLVVVIPGESTAFARVLAYCIAHYLGQDCVAVLDASGVGWLEGPQALRWLPFKPELFIMPRMSVLP